LGQLTKEQLGFAPLPPRLLTASAHAWSWRGLSGSGPDPARPEVSGEFGVASRGNGIQLLVVVVLVTTAGNAGFLLPVF